MVGLHHLWDHGAATQSFAIRAACPHPDYNRKTMENDLLLLQVGFAPAAGQLRGWGGSPWDGWCREAPPAAGLSRCAGLGAISFPHLGALSHLGDVSAHPWVLRWLCYLPPSPPPAGG